MEFPELLKKIASGFSGRQLKAVWNFQGWSRKNYVEHSGVVLVLGLKISVRCNTVLWNFYG